MARQRSLWVAMAVVLYLGAAALRVDARAVGAWVGLLGGLALALGGFVLAAPPPRQADSIDPAARRAARLVAAGLAMAWVARLGPSTAAFDAAGALGAALAGVGSLLALGRVGPLGLGPPRPPRWRNEAAIAAAAVWLVTMAVVAGELASPGVLARVPPFWRRYAVLAAALVTLAVSMVVAFRLYAERRHQPGVAERAAAALWLAVLSAALGVFAALASVAVPERAVLDATLLAAAAVTAAALSQHPTRISRLMRRAAALTLLCAPLLCVAVVVAFKVPTHAGLVVFVVTICAALLGLVSPRLARQLAPERGLWLDVLARAIAAAKHPDPRQAVTAALYAVAEGLGHDAGDGALYRLASADRLLVDRAGNLLTEPAALPLRLLEVAAAEPQQVLSVEALRHRQVKRPALRDLVAWLDARALGAAALVNDDEVCVGALAWPGGGRTAPLSEEELSLLRSLADHLGAVTGASAQLARSRRRELDANEAMTKAEAAVEELRAGVERFELRQRALSEVLARPARVASYSPAAQVALGEAERLGRCERAVTIVAPPGVDAVSWAAVIHLASARAGGLLHVVDATVASEQDLEHWADAAGSPLAVAAGGTLVVLDAHVLPADTQRLIGSRLGEDAGEPPGVVVVLPSTVDAMAAAGQLDEHLADRLGDRALVLPALIDRAEDLRALSLYKLSRIGVRLRGQPFGLSLRAQQRLGEHDWPGNEAELDAVLLTAALRAQGEVVDAADLGRLETAAGELAARPSRVTGGGRSR